MSAALETRRAAAREARLGPWIAALVVVHVLIAVVLISDAALHEGIYARKSDATRFHEIATAEGQPYEDFEVEYPPGLVLVAEALDTGDFGAFLDGVVALQLLADLGCAALLLRAFGRRACLGYLVLVAPLTPFVFTRLDVLPTCAVVGAVVLIRRRRERSGGALLAVAAATKLFAVALLPLLWIRHRRALAWTLGTGAALVAAWVAWSGPDAVRQVLTFRGARGWQVESVPGTLAWFFDGSAHIESGAWRVGTPPAVLGLLLVGVLVAGLVLVATRTRAAIADGTTTEEWGTPAAVCIALLLVTSTLLSPQFLIWLAPFAAIAGATGDRRTEGLTLAAILLTLAAQMIFGAEHSDTLGAQLAYWCRNGVLGALVITGLRTLGTRKGRRLVPAALGA